MSCFNTLGGAIHKAAGLTGFATRETCRVLRGSERAETGARIDWDLQYCWVQRGKYPLQDQQRKAILDEGSLRDVYLTYAFPSHSVSGTTHTTAQPDDTDERLSSTDQNTQGGESHINTTRPICNAEKQKLYTQVLCANIEQSWKAGRASLRYFYRHPGQVALNDSG